MARIRTIKPEFFLHEGLAELSPLHRLFFVGLWTVADKEGRLEDRPKRIKASVLPWEDCDVDELLWDLADVGLIIRYQSGGKDCIAIPSFKKHQRPHPKETSADLPDPVGAESREKKRQAVKFPGKQNPTHFQSRRDPRGREGDLGGGKEILDTPKPGKETVNPVSAMSGTRAELVTEILGAESPDLRERIEQVHLAVRKSVYVWRDVDDGLTRDLLFLADGSLDEVERVWAKALRTSFPKCLNLSSLKANWSVYAGVDPPVVGLGKGRATEAEKDWSRPQPTTPDGQVAL